jgi:hypothetical protein
MAVAAALALTGCADGYGYGGDGGLAYYDDYYGQFDDGYWRHDGFYYRNEAGRPYVRDEGNHFRHGPAPGFRGMPGHGGHYSGHGGGGEHGGGEHGGGRR